MFVQIAPRDTGPRNLENPIQNETMIPRTAAAAGTTLDHERLQARPFRIAQQASDQGSLLKSVIESDTTAIWNLLCQHVLDFVELLPCHCDWCRLRSPRNVGVAVVSIRDRLRLQTDPMVGQA